MALISSLLTSFEALKSSEQEKALSLYQPTDAVKERLVDVQRDLNTADLVRSKSYEEFNNLTLSQVLNRDRRAFNSHIPPKSSDPDEAWHADTVRPVTRNKVISIAAHITSSLLFPAIFAQNYNDNEDKDAALVMRDLLTWRNEQSDYAQAFLKAIIKGLVDPCMILEEGYAEVKRKIKVVQEDNSYITREVLDEIYSGFINSVVPCEELFIENIYESNIQKQGFLIRQKYISFSEAKAKYGEHTDFKFVTPGVKHFYSDKHDTFFELKDDDLESILVEEITYLHRSADLELILCNGVLVTDPNRPMQRADKMYPFAKNGYEFFGGTDFFYYKSLASKMSSDQEVIDALYNIIIDGSTLQAMPPGVAIGDEEFSSSVIIPGGVTTMAEGSSFQAINTGSNLNSANNALALVERSISESSADRLSQGMSADSTPATAFEVSRVETNARTMLGLFGKMVATFVEDFGKLEISTILQHMTVAEAVEVVGESNRLRFRQFLLPQGQGGTKPKKIKFNMELPESEKDQLSLSFKLLEEQEKNGTEIYEVNPSAFRRNKYLFKVKADFMPEQSEAIKKALNLEAYDRAIRNPLIDQAKITSEFLLESYRPGESDKFMKATQPMPQQASPEIQAGNSNFTSQILNKSMAGSGM